MRFDRGEHMSSQHFKLLIASPIHQKPAILHHFLHSLAELHCSADYYFIDDNKDYRSSQLLYAFQEMMKQKSHVIIETSPHRDEYKKDDNIHFWNEHLIWKVASFKDKLLEYAKTEQYDYIFFVDSDLLLHPDTINKLVASGKDIISEIFWTRWTKEAMEEPQVWMRDEYVQFPEHLKNSDSNEKYIATLDFYNQLRVAGVHKVGGLGACTLLSKKAIHAGVRFEKIYNLSFWGEDRHFCVRAVAYGFELFVETTYPAYHIYREQNLAGVEQFKKDNDYQYYETNPLPFPSGKKLTLSMIVKDEGEKFLREVLEQAKLYIDNAVIIDDNSSDDTKAIIREVLKDIPYILIENEESKFHEEHALRKQQWDEVVKTNPDWILNLDADEIFEAKFQHAVRDLINEEGVYLYSFRLFDFWSDTHYRDDSYWQAHLYYRPFLVKYVPDFEYAWNDYNQHSGRFPINIFQLPNKISQYRVKHLGWSREDIRQKKYLRYQKLDPDGRYGNMAQYESIKDEQPNLVEWLD